MHMQCRREPTVETHNLHRCWLCCDVSDTSQQLPPVVTLLFMSVCTIMPVGLDRCEQAGSCKPPSCASCAASSQPQMQLHPTLC